MICVGPPDSGAADAGVDDGGAADAGVDDGGAADAGVDAGLPTDGGAATGGGVCGLTRTNLTCTLYTATCGAGDNCNPNSSTNQGYDPCVYKVVSSNLAYRTKALFCSGGLCSDPVEGDPCTANCIQTPGDPRQTLCRSFYDGTKLCMPSCATDADCRRSTTYDSNLNNPQRVTNYCLNYGNGSGCQPALCFVEGQTGAAGNPAALYKPCAGRPNTVCLPRYVGSDSNIIGFCTAVKPSAASTVGQTCDPRAGREAVSAICGPDAVCLGARCAAVCDAAALGAGGTPTCAKDQTCISPQGLDLVADYQFGGCADPCDPFADLEHSGCVNYCGGSAARCNWIIGDPVGDQPRGYCGAAVEVATRLGQACSRGAIDPCEPGAFCLLGADGITRTCTHLCDPTAAAGTPDTCPTGLTCAAFAPLKRSGYCH